MRNVNDDPEMGYSESAQQIVFLLMGVLEKHDIGVPHEVVRLSLEHGVDLFDEEEGSEPKPERYEDL